MAPSVRCACDIKVNSSGRGRIDWASGMVLVPRGEKYVVVEQSAVAADRYLVFTWSADQRVALCTCPSVLPPSSVVLQRYVSDTYHQPPTLFETHVIALVGHSRQFTAPRSPRHSTLVSRPTPARHYPRECEINWNEIWFGTNDGSSAAVSTAAGAP